MIKLVFLASLSALCVPMAAFAQGPPVGSATMSGSITGTYSVYEPEPDTYHAEITATFKKPNGSNAYGYATGYPREKIKYIFNDGHSDEPILASPSPDVFGEGQVGTVNKSENGTLNSIGPYYRDGTPMGFLYLVRHWKLLGYAGSQEAYASADLGDGVLAPIPNITP